MRNYVRASTRKNSNSTQKVDDVPFKSRFATLGDFHDALGIVLRGPYVPVCYGGTYVVKRSRIERVPPQLLRNLTQILARGDNIEEGHMAERTWAALFMDVLSIDDQILLQGITRSVTSPQYALAGALILNQDRIDDEVHRTGSSAKFGNSSILVGWNSDF
jgi:hypothetical protein